MALQSGSQEVKSNKSATLPHENLRGKSPMGIMSNKDIVLFLLLNASLLNFTYISSINSGFF